MSIIVEAVAALNRWKSMYPDDPSPSVALYVRDLDKPVYFNGLAVSGTGVISVSAPGYTLPIYVFRESDIERVVIGDSQRGPIGFTRETGPN